jgi:hypothetical protein
MDLKDWFKNPSPPITHNYNAPQYMTSVDSGNLPHGFFPQDAVTVPDKVYDLGSYQTPFGWLFKRPRNVLQA